MSKTSKTLKIDWLRGMKEPPTYFPTEEEFADPVAYIRSIQTEAGVYGICRIVPPFSVAPIEDVKKRLNAALLALSGTEFMDSKTTNITQTNFSEESLGGLTDSKFSNSLSNIQEAMDLEISGSKSNQNANRNLVSKSKIASADLSSNEPLSTQDFVTRNQSLVPSIGNLSVDHFSGLNSSSDASQNDRAILNKCKNVADKSDSKCESKGSFTTLELRLGGPAVKNEGMRSTQKLAARRQRPSKRWYSIDEFEAKASAFFEQKFGESKTGKLVSDFEIEKAFWNSTTAIKACLVECSADISYSLFPAYRPCCISPKKSNSEKDMAMSQKGTSHLLSSSAYYTQSGMEKSNFSCNERSIANDNSIPEDKARSKPNLRFENKQNDGSLLSNSTSSTHATGYSRVLNSNGDEETNDGQMTNQLSLPKEGITGNENALFSCSSLNDKLAKSAWNLCHIPHAEGSLLNHVQNLPITDMAAPRVKIGMLFSWFGWSTDGYQFYSVNYMHFGSPATWYAVPGKYAECMEETVRQQIYNSSLPSNAVAKQLSKGISLMHPHHLLNDDVPCYRTVQNVGEFIITFPGAYRLVLNHGFNCIESSNLACAESLILPRGISSWNRGLQWAAEVSHEIMLLRSAISICSNKSKFLQTSHGNDLVFKLFYQQMKNIRKLLLKLTFHGAICIIDLEKKNEFNNHLLPHETNAQFSSKLVNKKNEINAFQLESKPKAIFKTRHATNICNKKNIHSSLLQDYAADESPQTMKSSDLKNQLHSNFELSEFSESANYESQNEHSQKNHQISSSNDTNSITFPVSKPSNWYSSPSPMHKLLNNRIQLQIQIQNKPGITRLFLSNSSETKNTKRTEDYTAIQNLISEFKFKIHSQENPLSFPFVTCAVCGIRCCTAFALIEPLHSENIRKASMNTKSYNNTYNNAYNSNSNANANANAYTNAAFHKANNYPYPTFMNNHTLFPNSNVVIKMDSKNSKGGNPPPPPSTPLSPYFSPSPSLPSFLSDYQDLAAANMQKNTVFANTMSNLSMESSLKKKDEHETYASPPLNCNPLTSFMFHPSPSSNSLNLEMKSNTHSNRIPSSLSQKITSVSKPSISSSKSHCNLSSSNYSLASSFSSPPPSSVSPSPSSSTFNRWNAFESRASHSFTANTLPPLESNKISPQHSSINVWPAEDRTKQLLEVRQSQNRSQSKSRQSSQTEDEKIHSDFDLGQGKNVKDNTSRHGKYLHDDLPVKYGQPSKPKAIEDAHLHAFHQIHQNPIHNHHQHQHQHQHPVHAHQQQQQQQQQQNQTTEINETLSPQFSLTEQQMHQSHHHIRPPSLFLPQQKYHPSQQQLHFLSQHHLPHQLSQKTQSHIPFQNPNDEKSMLLLNYLTKDNIQNRNEKNQNVRRTKSKPLDSQNQSQSQDIPFPNDSNLTDDMQKMSKGIDLNSVAEIESSNKDEKGINKKAIFEFDLNQEAYALVSASVPSLSQSSAPSPLVHSISPSSAFTSESEKGLFDLNETVLETENFRNQKGFGLNLAKPKGFDLNVSIFEKDAISLPLNESDSSKSLPKDKRISLSSVSYFSSPSAFASLSPSLSSLHPIPSTSIISNPNASLISNKIEKSLRDRIQMHKNDVLTASYSCNISSDKEAPMNGLFKEKYRENLISNEVKNSNSCMNSSEMFESVKEKNSKDNDHVNTLPYPPQLDFNSVRHGDLEEEENDYDDDDADNLSTQDHDANSKMEVNAKDVSKSIQNLSSNHSKGESLNEKKKSNFDEKSIIMSNKPEDYPSLETQLKKPRSDSVLGIQSLSKSMSISALEKMIKLSNQIPIKPSKSVLKSNPSTKSTPSETSLALESQTQSSPWSTSVKPNSETFSELTPAPSSSPNLKKPSYSNPTKQDAMASEKSKKEETESKKDAKKEMESLKLDRILVKSYSRGLVQNIPLGEGSRVLCLQHADMAQRHFEDMCGSNVIIMCHEDLPLFLLLSEILQIQNLVGNENAMEEEGEEEEEEEDEEEGEEDEEEKEMDENEQETDVNIMDEHDKEKSENEKSNSEIIVNEMQSQMDEVKVKEMEKENLMTTNDTGEKNEEPMHEIRRIEGGMKKNEQNENDKTITKLDEEGEEEKGEPNNGRIKYRREKEKCTEEEENGRHERKCNGVEERTKSNMDKEIENGCNDERNVNGVCEKNKKSKHLTGVLDLRHVSNAELEVIRYQISFLESRKTGNVSSSDWINLFDFHTLKEKKQSAEEEERRKKMEKGKEKNATVLPSSISPSHAFQNVENGEGGVEGEEERRGEKVEKGGKERSGNAKTKDASQNCVRKEKGKERSGCREKEGAKKKGGARGGMKSNDESKNKKRKMNGEDEEVTEKNDKRRKERTNDKHGAGDEHAEMEKEKEMAEEDRKIGKGGRGRKVKSQEEKGKVNGKYGEKDESTNSKISHENLSSLDAKKPSTAGMSSMMTTKKKRKMNSDTDPSTMANSLILLSSSSKKEDMTDASNNNSNNNKNVKNNNNNNNDLKNKTLHRHTRPLNSISLPPKHLHLINGQNKNKNQDKGIGRSPMEKRAGGTIKDKKEEGGKEEEEEGDRSRHSTPSLSSAPSLRTPLSPLRFLSYAAASSLPFSPSSPSSPRPSTPPSIDTLEMDELSAVAALMSVFRSGERMCGGGGGGEGYDKDVDDFQTFAQTSIGGTAESNIENRAKSNVGAENQASHCMENNELMKMKAKKKGVIKVSEKMSSFPSEGKKKAKFDVISLETRKKKNGVVNASKFVSMSSLMKFNEHEEEEEEEEKRLDESEEEEDDDDDDEDEKGKTSGGNYSNHDLFEEIKRQGKGRKKEVLIEEEGKGRMEDKNFKFEVTRRKRERRERSTVGKERLERICRVWEVGNEEKE